MPGGGAEKRAVIKHTPVGIATVATEQGTAGRLRHQLAPRRFFQLKLGIVDLTPIDLLELRGDGTPGLHAQRDAFAWP